MTCFDFLVFFTVAVTTPLLLSSSVAQLLHPEEVLVLQSISAKLRNRFWKVDQNFCSGGINLSKPGGVGLSNVTCNCSFMNNSICHVTHIQLKSLNLSGTIPLEFGNLSYLQELDLTRNYLSGSIPPLGNAPITTLSLMANRLSGSILRNIGDFSTLEDVNLEDNLLGGPLPESFGKLGRLKRLLLSANNFTGSIPASFGKLKNLTDFRIDGNTLTGKIPDFIGNLTKLEKLYMQGTSMDGPIPSTFSLLVNMKELRITDLKGGRFMKFPDFSGSTKLTRLVLRNCLINDVIPEFISRLANLKSLDLSYNNLTGPILGGIQDLDLDHLFLTNNSLSGDIPDWVSNNKNSFDLSYNNFSGLISLPCQMLDVNLASSFIPSERNQVPWCFTKGLSCSQGKKYHSLFVNCGGGRTEYGGNIYEEDFISAGASTFVSALQKWAYSSTGIFMGNEASGYLAVASNQTAFDENDSNIYNSARLSPISLKYYGLCMRKGSYTVRLHFAEIMFSEGETFSSLGRRIFDVSIQGKIVLKDFNIMEKAGGAYKKYVATFSNVTVDGTTLEVDLYWAGKGTNSIPERGVYGPLINAIEVIPNFDVSDGGLSIRAISGIVVASFVILLVILAILVRKLYLGRKDLENKELRGMDLQTGYFTLRQIKAATGNFDSSNKIGEGGFGPVYKGVLSDGTVIAVKQLSSKSKQGNREFVNEIGMISALQHPNLVRLYGCCIEGNQLLLVYEYMENNSLARALFRREGESGLSLDWGTRRKICLGIAKGLAYLHEESRLKIVHRDIKATNVLLDKDLCAKISDFGLAKLDDDGNTHISTRIAGTIGYMAPEYAMRGCLTYKADVYSFGIVVLEIVSGKSNTSYRPKEEFVYLLDWAYVLQEQGNLLELLDPGLGEKASREEALGMLHVALLCTNPSPTLRPAMSSVVRMLEGKDPVQVPAVRSGSLLFAVRNGSAGNRDTGHLSSFSQESRGPWSDSSASLPGKGRDPGEVEGEKGDSWSTSSKLL